MFMNGEAGFVLPLYAHLTCDDDVVISVLCADKQLFADMYLRSSHKFVEG